MRPLLPTDSGREGPLPGTAGAASGGGTAGSRSGSKSLSAPQAVERRMGGLEAVLLVVGSMVGTGILVTPALVSASTGSLAGVLLVWGGGALYALLGALSQAELATRYPRAGGDYVFLRESFGPLPAFLCGWVSLTIGFAGSIAALARTCGQYLLRAFPGVAGWLPVTPAHTEQTVSALSAETGVAIALILALTVVNLLGVSAGSRTQAVLTAAKVAGLAVLMGVALWASPQAPPPVPPSLPLSAALLPVVFSYTGWNDAIYVGGEITRPGRNLPLALIAGTAAVALLYLLFNAAFVLSTGGHVGQGKDLAVAAAMAEVALGPGSQPLVASLAALLVSGTMAALAVTGPRIAYAMARDAALPQSLGRLNARQAPTNALLFQAAVAVLFVLAGSLQQIIEWVGFALVVFSALATACIFVERARRPLPENATGYRIPLWPLPPVLYIGISLAIAVAVALEDPGQALYGILLVLSGLPVYWLSRSKTRLKQERDPP
ncbi:MAG: amino acid permease [Deltaproteobacteria bacterium]|nr:amino acid permease [Deltaproteobacteria bacterium]